MFADTLAEPGGTGSLFNAAVVPRPIGWISTVDNDGHANLAPFSYFNPVSAAPPMVVFGCNASHADGGEKDTLRNVRSTREFVVNLATWALRDAVVVSATRAPRGIDEFELAGLAKAACVHVRAPRVAASPVSIECRLIEVATLPADPVTGQRNQAVFGRVVGLHVDDAHIDADGRFDVLRARPLARLGGWYYGSVTDRVALQVPAWDAVHDRGKSASPGGWDPR